MLRKSPLVRLAVVTCLLTSTASGSAAERNLIRFRRHVVDATSEYCACAAIDVNRDGRLDIVCGGFWFEAPSWQRHFLREVQMIRGRFDDYANLPLDVNGDGWTDILSANYRSRSLYWVQHPGESDRTWTRHVIDTPGAMETGRLADVNDDGQMDCLPNGVKFAAWWEFERTTDTTGTTRVRWHRHDLPVDVAGHGIGFGDVNGDGRNDIVGPRGWLEAPEDRRAGRWLWHSEFSLHRDCSIPILVWDADEDGDADIVWGRGHDIGLYWLQQSSGPNDVRKWTRHAIDTSWSQPHSILLGDIDGDGRDELIAGKRYMGHDGKDPGEYDPLAIYWYDYDASRETWRRHEISSGGPAGVGLDPKAIDLDADGDVDVLVAGRSGLFFLENLRVDSERTPGAADERSVAKPPQIADHTKLLVYPTSSKRDVPPQEVTSPADWALRRADILQGLEAAMGRLPDPSRRVPLNLEVLETVDGSDYVRKKITFAAEHKDRVPAYLLIPSELKGRAPAMLCLHQTTSIGKDEPIGMGPKVNLHYAHELAQRGYICIVPDYPSFGEYPYDFQSKRAAYASGSMKAIWNNIRALDVLETLPQVDHDRIGCIGHSLGGHNGLFTAVFDQRIRAIVTSCGFTAFAHYYQGDLRGWTSDRYMPRIRDIYGNDPQRVPFDFHEILAALAPRGVFINAPQHDGNFARPGVVECVEAARDVYRLLGRPGAIEVTYPDAGHDFPAAVRQAAYTWLDKNLQSP